MSPNEVDAPALDVIALRDALRNGSVDVVVDDMARHDIPALSWSGNALHLESMAAALDRAATGEVDYLVARAPGGHPVAKAGIDYTARPGTGTIWQVATHPRLEGLGLCRRLFVEAERRIAARGLRTARLGVERDNARARRLYAYLGYVAVGEEPESWQTLDEHGNEITYRTVCELMEKPLPT